MSISTHFKNDNFDWKKPQYAYEIKRRLDIYQFLYQQENPRQFAKAIFQNDPVGFINTFVWTLDPRLQGQKIIPFLLFDRQIEYIDWLINCHHEQKNGIILKSRDMGISWINCAVAVWFWLYHDAANIVFGSYKQEIVDRLGDMGSIMEKCRFIISRLPTVFLPEGFSEREHTGSMKIINPENMAAITGQIGRQLGRGGRTTVSFLDEASFVEAPMEVDGALSQNSNVIIYVTTVRSVDDYFYKKYTDKVIPSFKFHWSDDPRKDNIWYEEQKLKLHPIILAKEVDINPYMSTENICIQYQWIMAAVNFDIEIDENDQIVAGLDVAGGSDGQNINRDSSAICLLQGGRKITHIEEWKEGDTTFTARKAYSLCSLNGVNVLNYDNIGVGAGVKSEMRVIMEDKDYSKGEFKMRSVGVNVGTTASKGYYKEGKKNEDMFLNLKAELWWKLAERFHKTYQHVKGIKKYPHSELISIPKHDKLIEELSTQKVDYGKLGKIKMVDKKTMKEEGIKSPNLADALVLSTHKFREVSVITI